MNRRAPPPPPPGTPPPLPPPPLPPAMSHLASALRNAPYVGRGLEAILRREAAARPDWVVAVDVDGKEEADPLFPVLASHFAHFAVLCMLGAQDRDLLLPDYPRGTMVGWLVGWLLERLHAAPRPPVQLPGPRTPPRGAPPRPAPPPPPTPSSCTPPQMLPDAVTRLGRPGHSVDGVQLAGLPVRPVQERTFGSLGAELVREGRGGAGARGRGGVRASLACI